MFDVQVKKSTMDGFNVGKIPVSVPGGLHSQGEQGRSRSQTYCKLLATTPLAWQAQDQDMEPSGL
jgi:hypothetical protein